MVGVVDVQAVGLRRGITEDVCVVWFSERVALACFSRCLGPGLLPCLLPITNSPPCDERGKSSLLRETEEERGEKKHKDLWCTGE